MRDNQTLPAYKALCLQMTCFDVNSAVDKKEARSMMTKTLDRLEKLLPMAKGWAGHSECKLVTLPEFFLTGAPMGEFGDWADKASLEINGPEYNRLSEIAQKNTIFLAGNVYELDPNFEGLYFETSFIIDPTGEVVLRYRRVNSLYSPSPHDLWDKYLDIYGMESVFPVAKTEIGNLGAVASEEIKFPEVARCLAMRGAQVIICNASRLTESATMELEICTRARAIENMAYVITCNTGGYAGSAFPANCVDGQSILIGFQGHVLGKAGGGESFTAAEIDLQALTRYRRTPGMDNLLARQRFSAYAGFYQEADFHRPNAIVSSDSTRESLLKQHRDTMKRLIEKGVL